MSRASSSSTTTEQRSRSPRSATTPRVGDARMSEDQRGSIQRADPAKAFVIDACALRALLSLVRCGLCVTHILFVSVSATFCLDPRSNKSPPRA